MVLGIGYSLKARNLEKYAKRSNRTTVLIVCLYVLVESALDWEITMTWLVIRNRPPIAILHICKIEKAR